MLPRGAVTRVLGAAGPSLSLQLSSDYLFQSYIVVGDECPSD